ncbi:MAG: glycosyltransferase [Acidimicrobiaceae bacterium]|nr:glycosyltransferase [Acidimicrobiaceae bacterium]
MNRVVVLLSDTTWASSFVSVVVLYYVALWIASMRRERNQSELDESHYQPFVVVMVPALNEEKVIGQSLNRLLEIPYDNLLILMVDDGSDDSTRTIAQEVAARTDRLLIVERQFPEARLGKSAALNHGLAAVHELIRARDGILAGRSPSEVLIGIVDADGSLDLDTMSVITPYFADAQVGQLQIGVKIANATSNLLTRLQDMEFVGFSSFVQVARDRIGSSGLGGNGQFTRLSALDELGRAPWTPTALTEDLDLGLALVALGWQTRFTNRCFVHQQGLTRWRPLLRQRTRWIQGHYQCWKHIPQLLKSSKVRLAARLDLVVYLLLVVTVVVVTFLLLTGLSTLFGWYVFHNEFLSFLPYGGIRNAASAFLMLAPITAFLTTYQHHSDARLRFWELPAFGFVFTLYSYVWVIATARAWGRMLFRRKNWVKTPRVAAVPIS